MTTADLSTRTQHPVHYKTIRVGDQSVFYRDAGPVDAPALLLLHGFPTSSNMFRNLIPRLAGSFRLIAPDYPGFGQSSMPDHDRFAYTFESYANIVDQLIRDVGLKTFSLYLMDYGAPVGYRLALKIPDRVQALIVQNGNAYDDGLREFWDPIKKYWANPTPNHLAGRSGWLGPTGQSRDPNGSFLRLSNERPALSQVPGILSDASAADTDRLGQERRHFPTRRGDPVRARSAERRDTSARHRPLCARDALRGNRDTNRGVST
jgi:pimeloyl-ACP methyl ester carboxylesterase